MFPLQTVHILQAGFKFLFDVDPVLTEHIFRNILSRAQIISASAGTVLRAYNDKFAEAITPIIHDLRNARLSASDF